jgi:hypothetical protein
MAEQAEVGQIENRNASPMSRRKCCQNVASPIVVLPYLTGIAGFSKAGELGFQGTGHLGFERCSAVAFMLKALLFI